ncbi:hypothetical protein D9615_009508 [Tricholomella constricta]|uniref:Uncharacterized protein n=1 Tax=Tricholomella constricta TaxID=117010 RepID=A0A8H5GYU3_9AGAR|nr:hypothetical protein D9615_009508 [Tricholomella constricta]
MRCATDMHLKRQSLNDALVQQYLSASWIWTAEGPTLRVPGGDRAFRATYSPRSGVAVTGVNILIAADDYFTIYVNGETVGDTRYLLSDETINWAITEGYALTINTESPIVFAVLATNVHDPYGAAAGLLVTIQLILSDGSSAFMSTGGPGWRATIDFPNNFQAPGTNDAGWSSATTISKNGADAPWHVVRIPSSLKRITLASPNPPKPTTPNAPSPNKPDPTSQGADPPIVTSGHDTDTSTRRDINTDGGTSTTNGVASDGLTSLSPSITTSDSITGTNRPIGTGAGTADSSVSTTDAPSKSPIGAIIGGAVGGFVLLLLLLGLFLCYRRRRRRTDTPAVAALNSGVGNPVSALESPPSTARTVPLSSEMVPFTLQSPGHDGMRSRAYNEKTRIYNNFEGGVSSPEGTEIESSTASASGRGAWTEELRSTMHRLQQLTEELNRGLVTHGSQSPQAVALSGQLSQFMRENSTVNRSVSSANGDEKPPPYEGRQDAS